MDGILLAKAALRAIINVRHFLIKPFVLKGVGRYDIWLAMGRAGWMNSVRGVGRQAAHGRGEQG